MKLIWTPHASRNAPSLTIDAAAVTGLILMDIEGLPTASGTPVRAKAVGRAGDVITGMTVPGRMLAVRAVLKATDQQDYWQQRHTLARSLATPQGEVWLGTLQLDRTAEGVSPALLNIPATPQESPKLDPAGVLADWVDIEWVCESPYWMEPTELQTSFSIDQPGGLTFPLVFPVVFPDGQYATSFTVDNPGSAETWPRFVFTGPMTNVRLTNTSTQRTLKVPVLLGYGETLVVDMAPATRRVDLESAGGTTDLIGKLTVDSRFWSLRPGDNGVSIEIDTSTSGSGAMYWQPAHAGV